MTGRRDSNICVTTTPGPMHQSTVRRSRVRKGFKYIERILAIVGLCFIVYHLCFDIRVMTSESMAPTLQGVSYEVGDWILVEKVSRWIRSPRREEIFFYYDTDGEPVMKRVVGMPGERISIRDSRIHINGVELERPESLSDITYYAYGNLRGGIDVDCGRDYFMLGDDSTDSNDSRYTGVVPGSAFRGRALCVIWPLSRVGFVK